jgi:hypothetical protein
MAMRDLQRLEELSSTAALGLWADDVVLAVHRVLVSSAPSDADAQLLLQAADALDAAKQRVDQPLSNGSSTHALAAIDTALSVVATLAERPYPESEDRDERAQVLLGAMAEAVRRVGSGDLKDSKDSELQRALSFFGRLSETKLVESNSVLASRKDSSAWTAIAGISNF